MPLIGSTRFERDAHWPSNGKYVGNENHDYRIRDISRHHLGLQPVSERHILQRTSRRPAAPNRHRSVGRKRPRVVEALTPAVPIRRSVQQDHVVCLAVVAAFGWPANRQDDAVYPYTEVDGAGQKLSGGHKYTLTFAKGQKLISSKVYMGDTAIGQIEDLLVALDQATVTAVILSVGGFLGIGDKLVAVPVKQELGLGHYEGRGRRGFHHHAPLPIAAYGFLDRRTRRPSPLRTDFRPALAGIWPSRGLPTPTARPCDMVASIVFPLLTCCPKCRPNRHQRRVPRDGLYIEGVA
jgi:PRC-barrel domain